MNELILLFGAFFVLMTGVQFISSMMDFGFAVADKVLQNWGRIAKAPFKILVFFYQKWKKSREYYTVTPINMTSSEIQSLSQPTLNKKLGHAPVETEYTQPKLKIVKGK